MMTTDDRPRPVRGPSRRLVSLFWAFAALALLLAPMAGLDRARPAEAHHTSIKMPFAGGANWRVLQGYNSNPPNGSHYNCDPATGKDAATQRVSCNAYYQYRYSLDLVRSDGQTSGQPVLSPVDGTVRWTDAAFGGISINLGDGWAFAFFHVDLIPSIASQTSWGQTVTQGQLLGYASPPGEGGNGGTPHIHVTLWETTDGGNWDRKARPFTGDHKLDGYEFTDLGASSLNQHRNATVVSTNRQTSTAPTATPSSSPTRTATPTRTAAPSVTGGSVAVSPSSGRPGTLLTISGSGFSGSERVDLSWDSGGTWQSVTASGGAFTLPSTAPNLALGSHTLRARGATSGRVATAAFQTTTSGNTGSTMTSPGVYSIIATREGLVGGTTSSGHVITSNDHFVSLPGCVASNCNWLAPGQWNATWGYVTPCGNNCYVMITNPTNGKCSVGPVLDWGPWFQVDNWWETNANRTLNSRASNPNYLDRGYPATDAIYANMNVGWGPGRPDRASFPSRGNRAAADIGDGIWYDIGYNDAGPTPVIATMLWQTGQSAASAIASCSSGSTPSATPTRTPTPNGTPTRTSTPTPNAAFKPGDVVVATSGSGLNCRTAPVNGAVQFVIPNGAQATVTAVDSATKTWFKVTSASGSCWVSGQYLRLASGAATPTPTRTPTAGPTATRTPTAGATATRTATATPTRTPAPGAKVTLSASKAKANATTTATLTGYGPNEMVRLSWDGVQIATTATTDANGKGNVVLRTPRTNGRHSLRAQGVTSGKFDTMTLTIVASFTLSPNAGGSGDSVTARGTGFVPSSSVTVRWNVTTPGSGSVVCSRSTDANGSFTCTFAVPGPSSGAYRVVATNGEITGKATFTVNVAGLIEAEAPSETGKSSSTPTSADATESPAPDSQAAEPTVAPTEPVPPTTEPPTPESTMTATTPPEPTPVPTEPPTPIPAPIPRELVLAPISDASVAATTPDQPQPAETAGVLSGGGPDGNAAFITFAVEGIGAGTVLDASIVLTSGGGPGASGGQLGVIWGAAIDEWSLTYSSAPFGSVSAAYRADGSPATIDWLESGGSLAINLTGVVTQDGLITIVVTGLPDAVITIASRESGAPPLLLLTVIDPP